MTTEKVKDSCTDKTARNMHKNAHSSAVYCLGIIGAAVYYIIAATSFWGGVLGVLKAIVWPAFLVYEIHKYFEM